jgi:hypothetical protein
MEFEGRQESQPYDETLDAAKIFENISRSAAKKSRQSGNTQQTPETKDEPEEDLTGEQKDAPNTTVTPPGQAGGDKAASRPTTSDRPLLDKKEQPTEQSVGELFSKLVRMSPEDKIRIEQDSIGSLFKKYITKRG